MKFYAVWFLGVVTIGFSWLGAEAKSHKTHPTTGVEGLMYAAGKCDLPALKSVIASGVNVSGTDAGSDALRVASLNRKLRGNRKTWWMLKCPAVVAALTEAGADPWKATFYQNPSLDQHRPNMIAVIRVEDNREQKGESEKIIADMTDGVELQLHHDHVNHLGYPIVALNEVRQKLRTSGFSAEDTIAPDRVKACKALGADSVFEASLEDFRSKSIGITSSAGVTMRFVLTDCKTGDLLWRADQYYTLAEGFLASAFGHSKVKQIITGFAGQPAIAFPVYKK